MDNYVQCILFDIGFYIILLQIVDIKRKYNLLLLPSFVVYVMADFWIIYMFFHPEYISTAIFSFVKTMIGITFLIAYSYLFEGGIWKVAVAFVFSDWLCGIPHMLVAASDAVNPEKLRLFFFPELRYIPYGVLAGSLLFGIEFLLLRKYLRRLKTAAIEKKTYIRILVVLWWGLIVLQPILPAVAEGLVGKTNGKLYLLMVLSMVILVVTLYGGYRRYLKMKQYYLRQQNQLEQEHYEVLKNQIDLSGKYQKDVMKYFVGIKAESKTIKEQFRKNSVEEVLQQVLENKISKAQEYDINVKTEIGDICVCEINEMDIVILLYNILDNAIESCMKISDISERWIRLNIGKEDGKFIIRCENAREGQAILAKGHRTWKRDKKLHGTGMEIMRDITKKYHGTFLYKEGDKNFQTEIRISGEK